MAAQRGGGGFNRLVTALLRSRLHRLVSRRVLLLRVTGRKTGRLYALPVEYVCHEDTFYITSRPDRTWWRNLRTEAPVDALLQGVWRGGTGRVVSAEDEDVRAALEDTPYAEVIRQHPDRILVRLTLSGSPLDFPAGAYPKRSGINRS